jgi:catechol 2,3-dioxygenase-like lactoylglutathione lyase family enzyme
MSDLISTQGVHHLTLTVSDVARSEQFYAKLFNFQRAAEFGPRVIMSNGGVLLVLTPPPDPAQAIPQDRFNENRIGLDHVSFGVDSMAALEAAIQVLDAQGVEHGDITPLEPFGIAIMAIRDPDNIQIELTAPLA